MSTVTLDDMTLATSVVETVVSIAADEVKGIASIGSYTTKGLRRRFQKKPSTSGIEVRVDDDNKVHIDIHIEVYYGYVLPELADELRRLVSESLQNQLGIAVSSIDIYVDGVQFKK